MYEGLLGEVKTFFLTGLMFPNEEEYSSTPVQGAVGSEGYSALLGTALHSGTADSFSFSAAPVHDRVVGSSRFSFPPLCHPERKVYSDFNTVFVPLLLLAAGVGLPAACFLKMKMF